MNKALFDTNVTLDRVSMTIRKRCKAANHPVPWHWADGKRRTVCPVCSERLNFGTLDQHDPIRMSNAPCGIVLRLKESDDDQE